MDTNYLFATPLLMIVLIVFMFLVSWIPVFALIHFIVGLIAGFFRSIPTRNVFRM